MDSQRGYLAGALSIGAGFVHALAAGTHVEHRQAALAIGLLALSQIGTGIWLLAKPNRLVKLALAGVSIAAVAGWVLTRTSGISFIDGLETSESVQSADLLCAILATLAVISLADRTKAMRLFSPALASVFAVALVGPASFATLRHQHNHAEASAEWPRAYFPGTVDIGGVAGVTPAQEARATQLITDTQTHLARWADYRVAQQEGWFSIGDGETGYEHFVNGRALNDGKFLDPTVPESIVYKVYGDQRILVSAMFMAEGEPAIDAPELVDYAGPLFEWHVHNDLCWSGLGDVAGVVDENGDCPPGSVLRPVNKPMIHVWVVPHPCGPFAAVEGLAEGQAAVDDSLRVDICGSHAH